MKAFTVLFSAALIMTTSCVPFKRDVDPDLIPQFGFTSGRNPTGTGDCDGAVNGSDGKPIKIPCACPPDRQVFINALNENVAAGHAIKNPSVKVDFPTDNSKHSQSARLTAAAITLQNLNGPGKGCPVVSTTFSAQQKAIDAGAPPPAPIPPPKSSSSLTKPLPAKSLSSSARCSAAAANTSATGSGKS